MSSKTIRRHVASHSLIEALESRDLRSASPYGSAVLANGVLSVSGTAGADQISVSTVGLLSAGLGPNVVQVRVNYNANQLGSSAGLYQFSLAKISSIAIDAGAGNDTVLLSTARPATVNLSDGNDRLDATPFQAGAVIVFGGAGNDSIYGGSSNDELHGGAGDDVIDGRQGDDKIFGDDGNDSVYGNTGNDELHGGNGNDHLFGQDGDDRVYGEAGNDVLDGGTGRNVLTQ